MASRLSGVARIYFSANRLMKIPATVATAPIPSMSRGCDCYGYCTGWLLCGGVLLHDEEISSVPLEMERVHL